MRPTTIGLVASDPNLETPETLYVHSTPSPCTLVDEIVLPEATRVLARSWFGCDQSDGTEVPVEGKLGPHAAAIITIAGSSAVSHR
jgi:hypothetical protein